MALMCASMVRYILSTPSHIKLISSLLALPLSVKQDFYCPGPCAFQESWTFMMFGSSVTSCRHLIRTKEKSCLNCVISVLFRGDSGENWFSPLQPRRDAKLSTDRVLKQPPARGGKNRKFLFFVTISLRWHGVLFTNSRVGQWRAPVYTLLAIVSTEKWPISSRLKTDKCASPRIYMMAISLQDGLTWQRAGYKRRNWLPLEVIWDLPAKGLSATPRARARPRIKPTHGFGPFKWLSANLLIASRGARSERFRIPPSRTW